MAKHSLKFMHKAAIPLAISSLFVSPLTVHAQQATLAPVTVTSQSAPPTADVTGFGEVPLKEVPASATVITRKQIEAAGARRLADLTQFDSSVTDSYNAPGYWDFLAVRGFTLDNLYNYRREGLPFNAQTSVPLDNKERIEILKGTSGLQAGVSAPGGLVNYVVKRPTERDVREVTLEWSSRASVMGALDLGGRWGADRSFGYRINAAQEQLRPEMHNLDGHRSFLSLAGDWRINRDSVLEAEIEWSRKSQPSQTGFSVLGTVLPAVPDPRLNLNNQPWVQPTMFEGTTGTLRFSQSLSPDWKWSAQIGSQRLKTNDFTAFPYGCSAEGNYDRFCSDGTFDYYDFRSQDERRQQTAAALSLKGRFSTAGVTHDVSAGLTTARARDRFNTQAYNYVGTGTIDGKTVVPADPSLTYVVNDRDERSVELSLNDAVHWNESLTTWIGLRHTKLDRGYKQSLTTPWAAVSYKANPAVTLYASYGQGVESQRVPASPLFANAGDVLPALKSKQVEIGAKGAQGALDWQVAIFDIKRPLSNVDFCSRTGSPCVGQFDGHAVHRGVEASFQWTAGAWQVGSGVTLLRARREGSVLEPANNGKRPTNVPDAVLRANAAYKVDVLPGLELRANLSHEGKRSVFADESIELPAWTRLDAAVHYEHKVASANVGWTLGVDNVTNRRFWKESPFQFGHVYLYPGAPRTLRLTMNASL
ncbi:TonB-dependent siderophore receptor [Caenimonas koreensis DSM 17982]|uniref:TonB-dependent siderophore receptor n=1 Tax=Caenimonas koreensis DSM 17982 TaxID=1121255 RepID=A0A844B2E7_9BURK|nr:TonB-dependent siderophore receptor [Caenimonas koreensis]MRD45727.1 TonB-dependent siderophore receptor [Caenimonas koreensis DSM 17982]